MRWICLMLLLVVGCGAPSLLITPVSNTNKLEESEVQPGKGWYPPKIAIIEVEGMIINARVGNILSQGENKLSLFAQEITAAQDDDNVKAIVLRINSPGGTVTASDTMYDLVRRFKAKTKKPVVAATQEVAASGGYYIACSADKIVAQPTSVIGSIGVIFNVFNVEGTMMKLGVSQEAIKSAKLKDMGSPFKALSAEERAIMQSMVDEYYQRFVTIVKTNRPITDPEKLKLVTDGRVFSGEQAVALGLADQSGSLEDAIDLARTLSNSPKAAAIIYTRPYGYSGSIYASSSPPPPQSSGGINVNLPNSGVLKPTGFYYLWEP